MHNVLRVVISDTYKIIFLFQVVTYEMETLENMGIIACGYFVCEEYK